MKMGSGLDQRQAVYIVASTSFPLPISAGQPICKALYMFTIHMCIIFPLSLSLRLLTLWFDYGHLSEVHKALMKGVQTIDIDTWLQVIPQLIARIDHPRKLVSRLIHDLLTAVGKQHPQVSE